MSTPQEERGLGDGSSSDVAPARSSAAGGLFVDDRPGPPGAPLVVLVHGSMDRATSFARVRRHLDDLHVVTYDRRGYHRSRRAEPLATTLDDHVDDLVTVLAGRPAVVAGHSYGGDVALAGAGRLPELVQAVAAYEPPMPWMPWWPADSAGEAALSATSPGDAAEAFMRNVIGARRWERLPPRTRARRRSEGPALAAEIASIRGDLAPFDPAGVKVPTVVGEGELSSERHRLGAEALAHAIAGSELVAIPGAGHNAHLSHPRPFAQLVARAVELSGRGAER